MASEQEMMVDLAAADAAGDHELAQRIAAQIKAARAQPQHGRLAEALHATASHLPMAGGIIGGALGATAGTPFDILTGPLGTMAGGAAGAALLGGIGKVAQHGIDSAMGYEKTPGVLDSGKDALVTGGEQGIGAGLGGMAGEILGAVAKPASPLLRGLATATTKRILRNTGGSLSAAKPLSDEAAQEALDMGVIKPFGTSAGAAERLSVAREQAGAEYSRIVKELEAHGITGPDAQALAQKFTTQASSQNPLSEATPIYEKIADKLSSMNGPASLSESEAMKRSLQDQARSAYKQLLPNEVGRAKEDAASILRQANENAIDQQAAPLVVSPEVKDLAAQFQPVKQQTGRLIEADNVAQAGAARAANRNALSIYDILAGTGALGHSGSPVEAAASTAAMHLLRTRGPSTLAAAANAAAGKLEDPSSRILSALLSGGGAAAAPSLADIIAELRRNRSQQQPQQ